MKIIYIFLIFSLQFLFFCCADGNVSDTAPARPVSKSKPKRIVYFNVRREFNDLNDTHLAAASSIGIRPLASREGIPAASKKLYLVGGPMRYSEPFVVDELDHSSPFLVKEAYDLLHAIGKNFQDFHVAMSMLLSALCTAMELPLTLRTDVLRNTTMKPPMQEKSS